MRLVSIVIVVSALVLAIAVFLFVPRLLRGGGNQQAQQAQVVRVASQDVLVAAKTLPAGTVLKSDDVRFQKWPEEAIDASYQVREKGADPQKVAIGFVVLHGIEAGEPITPQRLLKPGEGSFLAAVLVPGMRAVTIKVDAISAEAGFILPQDRVDVVLNEHFAVALNSGTQQASQNLAQLSSKDVSSIILRDVRVLAIDQGVADIDSKPRVGATATLEVDLTQAQKVAIAGQLGSLSLVLRSHTLPTVERPEPASPIVEDYEVSPYRAALLRQVYSNLAAAQLQTQQANGAGGGGSLRVYRGAQLAGAQQ
jgi:pilus assembly protein CpaB